LAALKAGEGFLRDAGLGGDMALLKFQLSPVISDRLSQFCQGLH
jgi:hypothetical protein